MAPILGFVLAMLAADPHATLRDRMVREQIEAQGIRDPKVLRVMRLTPRHLFVPPELVSRAYDDGPLPIGYAATISQPFIVAAMTEMLDTRPSQRVLEIGTGSGYQAAVLAQLVKRVYTIEIVPQLAEAAARRLQALGYENVTVRTGDGYRGWPEEAPFERILLTAAPPEMPETLLAQLARGGRLVAPVGRRFEQYLYIYDKGQDGRIRKRSTLGVMFVPMVPGRK